MSKLIALCDGHGDHGVTPGKRSPKLPDGSVMYENAFNKVVVNYLKAELERQGFSTLLVAPTDSDTPLKTRTDLANAKKADLYISVHANANTSNWGDWGGIETFHYAGAKDSQKLAELVHSELIKGSPLTDRKVKTADFHVLRETHMPAILVELGFMDSNKDIKYLLSDAYRRECAIEICKGICRYFGLTYKSPIVTPPTPQKPVVAPKMSVSGVYRVIVDGKQVGAFKDPAKAIQDALKTGSKEIKIQKA